MCVGYLGVVTGRGGWVGWWGGGGGRLLFLRDKKIIFFLYFDFVLPAEDYRLAGAAGFTHYKWWVIASPQHHSQSLAQCNEGWGKKCLIYLRKK